MTLLDLGSWGYQIGAAGIVLFTIAFLFNIRWWTDMLGRVMATTLSTMSSVLIITTLRQLNIGLPGGILWWRIISFWAFGLGVWSALGTFVWAQFLAPRLRRNPRMTTRREHRNEETHLADRRHDPDVNLHDRAGGHDR